MPKAIDFSRLSIQDAFDLAILIEEEAKERYEEFVDQLDLHHTPEAADFFRQMVGNEAKHGDALAARRKQRFGDVPMNVTREMLWDVEAPEYHQVSAFMTVRQALEVALEAETKAHDFFAKAVGHLSDPEVKGLFLELQDEEIKHQGMVRQILAKLPADSALAPDVNADPPVAH